MKIKGKQLVLGLFLVFLTLNFNSIIGTTNGFLIQNSKDNLSSNNKVYTTGVASTTQNVNFTFNKQITKSFSGTFN